METIAPNAGITHHTPITHNAPITRKGHTAAVPSSAPLVSWTAQKPAVISLRDLFHTKRVTSIPSTVSGLPGRDSSSLTRALGFQGVVTTVLAALPAFAVLAGERWVWPVALASAASVTVVVVAGYLRTGRPLARGLAGLRAQLELAVAGDVGGETAVDGYKGAVAATLLAYRQMQGLVCDVTKETAATVRVGGGRGWGVDGNGEAAGRRRARTVRPVAEATVLSVSSTAAGTREGFHLPVRRDPA